VASPTICEAAGEKGFEGRRRRIIVAPQQCVTPAPLRASLYFVRNTELQPPDLHICAIAEDEEEEGDNTDEAEKLGEGEGEAEVNTANATTSGVTSSWRVTPLLASSSRDQTIRIWNAQTGSHTSARLLDSRARATL
jgi:hypothetical protein